MSKKISISTGGLQIKYGVKPALKLVKDAGFDGADFCLDSFRNKSLPDILNMEHSEFVEYFKDIRNYADEIGLAIPTVHSLLYPYCDDEAINDERRRRGIRDIEAASILGAKYCVMHSASTVIWGYRATPDFMHEINQRMYNDFVPTAEKFGVYLTLESFGNVKVDGVPGYDYFSHHKIMRDEFDSLDTEYKAFCLDSGHTNCAVGGGGLPVEDFVRYFGDRIKMLHLHDNNGFTDQHLIPGFGTIKWRPVFEALEEIGYDGYYNFELVLRFGQCTDESVKFLGKYLRAFVDGRGWP